MHKIIRTFDVTILTFKSRYLITPLEPLTQKERNILISFHFPNCEKLAINRYTGEAPKVSIHFTINNKILY